MREVEDRLVNLQFIEGHFLLSDPSNGRRIGPHKLEALPVRRNVEFSVAIALRVAQENLKNIAEAAKDLVVLGRLGKEMLVCQFAKNQEAIRTPADSHAGRQELLLGRVAPTLLHVQGRRISERGADRVAISDVKVAKPWANDFQCISTATVPIPERK